MLIESIESLLKEAFELDAKKRVELDIGALLRMDSERRMKALGDGVKNTILTPNEAVKVKTFLLLKVVILSSCSSRTSAWQRWPGAMHQKTHSRKGRNSRRQRLHLLMKVERR